MKSKFKKKGRDIIFVDDNKREWYAEHLQELINAFKNYKKFEEIKEHYFFEEE